MHHCRKYWLIAVFISTLCPFIKAQDTLTFAKVEAQSYSLYKQKNWDELISLGKKALNQGFDYYYLRYRLGVACFVQKRFRTASVHFEKAITFNSTDEAMEYLYYSYLYSEQYERARWLSKSFSAAARACTGSDKFKSFSFATLEAGIGITDSTTQFDSYYYMQASAGFYVNNRFSIFNAFSYFTQQDFRGITNQYQYYINSKVPLKNGWSLNLGIQPIVQNYSATIYSEDSIRFPIPSKIPPHIRDSAGYRDTFLSSQGSTKTKINLIGAVSLTKSVVNFDFTIGCAIGSFDTATQYEHYIGVAYYPMRNNFLLFGGTLYAHTENYYKTIRYGAVPYIIINPSGPLSLTLSYLTNTGGNLIEGNGYIVNETPDFMVTRFSCIATITLSKCIALYANYQHQDNYEEHKHWPFYYNLFIAGIKYIPK
jgi:hypothetical protein